MVAAKNASGGVSTTVLLSGKLDHAEPSDEEVTLRDASGVEYVGKVTCGTFSSLAVVVERGGLSPAEAIEADYGGATIPATVRRVYKRPDFRLADGSASSQARTIPTGGCGRRNGGRRSLAFYRKPGGRLRSLAFKTRPSMLRSFCPSTRERFSIWLERPHCAKRWPKSLSAVSGSAAIRACGTSQSRSGFPASAFTILTPAIAGAIGRKSIARSIDLRTES